MKSTDFFVAHLDDGGVRVGMAGGRCYDVPAGHAYVSHICECSTERDAEDYFNELYAALDA
ncbi:hypothetical protein WJ70_18015 [Burkholderia ubonensis]|uniref:hypothetical protein n=1 Tax=Burkholderia ubonensis TaxID=101571 RepID=UPI00075C3B55|nr:hypothetical protein [Burkholderia ubonensis]KVN90984.1 hypothetical protein WJ70_18015 [Burkholderia ubonensis]